MKIRQLRVWLQSSLLLAVLAGYGLLLLFNQGLASLQRRADHQELVVELAADLQRRLSSGEPWSSLRAGAVTPGLQLELLAPLPEGLNGPPRMEQRNGESWLVSSARLALPGGRLAYLQVRQNVSTSVRIERQAFWLLVAAAGVSSLVTSGLMRLVLRAGLLGPLQVLNRALAEADPGAGEPQQISEVEQPAELRPIATAFNAMQRRLVASWEQQRTFIDGVAHELRTPLTLIRGHAQRLERLLAEAPIEAEAAPLLQAGRSINAEAERMTRLVRDLLDLARREGDRLELQQETLDAGDVLLVIFERLEPLAAGRLRLRAPAAEADLRVCADPDRLAQCLTNLVENALKYAPAPTPVELAVERRGAAVELHVRDFGPGVPPGEREEIFQLFRRGSAAPRASRSGSGIGLAMVRLLMERMGGRVRVVDPPGGGADFRLVLPALRPTAPPAAA